MRQRRRAAAAGSALMLAGAGLLAVSGTAAAADPVPGLPAAASAVSYATECVPPPISGLDPVRGTTEVEISAPATAKVGDTVEVVWKTVTAASKNPDVLDLGKDTVLPTGVLTAAGAQAGEIAMKGLRQNPPIPKNSPMALSDMTGRLKLEKPGEVTLTPGAYTINVNKPVSTDTKCTPKEKVKPALTIKVTDGSGSSGGSSSGGSASGGSGSGGTSTSGGSSSGGSSSGGSDTGGSGTGGSSSGGVSGASGGSTGGGSGGGNGDPDGTAYKGKQVDVPYACKTPIGDKKATSPVQINGTKKGGAFDLTVKFAKSVMDSPADIPKDSVKPTMEVKLGGADKGTVHVEGPANKKEIKSGDPIEIPDLKGTYKPGASGKATLTPGVLTVKAMGTTTTCTPEKDPGVSLELDTSAQPGGASGGTGSGGTSGGDASGGGTGSGGAAGSAGGAGGLADTGAADHGGLQALGLAAGTVILLGGAVFTFMPRRYLRR
ncbi:hypothetical protein C3486_17110 [Streptomyces sp. Ru73]|uniref:hypothetical protein n=1 Tax=Streptomyces sp. Ru73 TaxID=2080748 RepID=UPI000CDDB130|nr:hypothetical protein [Streptomyces sp. Ru73]POX39725.1 hypothetical protein C3486_17110 [Streptomyces sp. Ru73]